MTHPPAKHQRGTGSVAAGRLLQVLGVAFGLAVLVGSTIGMGALLGALTVAEMARSVARKPGLVRC